MDRRKDKAMKALNESQIREIVKAADMLTRIYWKLMDNHENKKVTGRLDTILGKLYELTHLES